MKTTAVRPLVCALGLLFACSRAASAAAGGAAEPEEMRSAVERAAAAVVPALVRVHVVEVYYDSGREVKSEAVGSGVIFTAEGHVITNHHVAGNSKQLVCTLPDREEIDAELVGTDPLTDICVIKLLPKEQRDFPVARFGDSSRLKVGDTVLAMGSPHALSQSVTMGIVSNTQLVMPDLFWPFKFELEGEDIGSIIRWVGHDAELNPGNSGGPLVNLQGEVVGINEMQFGLGAAIPGNLARKVAEELVARGKISRAWLGLDVQPLLRSQSAEPGVLVSGTVPGSPAEQAGFKPGDLLVDLAGQPVSVRDPEELPIFNQLVADLPSGTQLEATIVRGGTREVLRVTSQEREAAQPKDRELNAWGITARDLSFLEAKEMRRKTRDGVLVTTVRPGGPCDEAKPKIIENDVIVAVAGTPVRRVDELAAATERITEDAEGPVPVLVALDRKAESYLTVVKVGKQPLPEPAREARKAWLAVDTQVLTRELAEALGIKDLTGVRVTQVYPGSSAERAGLLGGDLIVAVDGRDVPASRPEHFDVFSAMVRQYEIGSQVVLTILRDGKKEALKAAFEQSPESPREMKKYRDDSFEFGVRDVTLADRAREQWQEKQHGPLVDFVSEGGWAALAHLAVGDFILEVDGRRTADVVALEERMREIGEKRPNTVVLKVRRGIHTLYIELQPKWPEID